MILKIPKKTVKEGELKMVVALIEQTSEKFKPEQYVDTYKVDLLTERCFNRKRTCEILRSCRNQRLSFF